jgi:hypothetical protein
VKDNSPINTLSIIGKEDCIFRFGVKDNCVSFAFAYLVERKENCTNCAGRTTCIRQKPEHPELTKCCTYKRYECSEYKPKTENRCSTCARSKNGGRGTCVLEEGYGCDDYEQKAEKHTDYNHCEEAKKAYACAMTNACPEKHYRPFANTDELIKVWKEKIEADTVCDEYELSKYELPYVWVRYKMNQCGQMGILITKFEKNYVQIEGDMIAMHALMADYEFLDGSPCGVEE